jgi:uncharacterized RDD family membrane protein YckC
MSCPVCAGECQCGRSDEALRSSAGEHVAVLVDTDKYEASEEQCAASLSDGTVATEVRETHASLVTAATVERAFRDVKSSGGAPAIAAAVLAFKEPRPAEAPEWKHEVSSRVSRYRSRRRSRSEHNRSLALNFEAPAAERTPTAPGKSEPTAPPAESQPTPKELLDVHEDLYGLQRDAIVPSARSAMPVWRKLLALRQTQEVAPANIVEAGMSERQEQTTEFKGDTLSNLTETVRAIEMKNYVEISEAEAKVIEFPRPAETENSVELAEPVVAPPPRIFEAEDVEQAAREQAVQDAPAAAPPIPTFMLDSLPVGDVEELEFELPLPVAPVRARLFGLGLDVAMVGVACLLFGTTLFFMGSVPLDRPVFGLAALLAIAGWCFYQGMFLTRQGSTPGMRAAGLALTGFEQQPVTRRELKLRAWSVMLSSASLGLGFAWALLDEDRLCWHDRISRTCTTIAED